MRWHWNSWVYWCLQHPFLYAYLVAGASMPISTYTLIIEGELTDLNTFNRASYQSRWNANSIKKTETEKVARLAKSQLKPLNPPIYIEYRFYVKDRRKDPDNIVFARKFINDGLVDAGIIPNDGWKEIDGWNDVWLVDKENPRVEVIIKEVKSLPNK